MKPKVPNPDCSGQESGISLSTLDEGLETKSPGWDVGNLVCIPDLLKNMPISLDKSPNLPMPQFPVSKWYSLSFTSHLSRGKSLSFSIYLITVLCPVAGAPLP